MKNKQLNRIVILLILAIATLQVNSQTGRGRFHDPEYNEKIHSMKIAFITEKLSLSPAEAEKFWPVYNQFQKEVNKLKAKHREGMMRTKEIDELTDEEAARCAENEIIRIEEMASLKRKYHDKFLNILPVKKVALLYKAEREFNHKLFRKMRNRRQRN